MLLTLFHYFDIWLHCRGGAGGCVAAQAMVDNGKKVLLLERGGEPTSSLLKKDVFAVLNSKTNNCIETFDGDGVVVATGNCLGGATTYNQGIWIEDQPIFLNSYGGLFKTENVAKAFDYVRCYFEYSVWTGRGFNGIFIETRAL